MQETHDAVNSFKRVLSHKADTISKPSNISTKNVWKFYVKLRDFEAQCIFCENKYSYMSFTNFQIHVATHHRKIWTWEKEGRQIKWLLRYFKYLDDVYSQCIIYDVNVLSTKL